MTPQRLFIRLALVPLLLVLGACAPRQLLVRSLADELAGPGQTQEEDIGLLRESSAFYLKLSESVLRQTPGHVALAETVAGGLTQYAYAFVAFEAERLAARDAQAALALRQRAARLYLRARDHALAALTVTHPDLTHALAHNDPAAAAPVLAAQEVGLAYWAAAAWGGYISLSKDDPEVVADFPQVYRLAALAWARDPEHGDGALASLMGTLEAARPAGSPTRALSHFDAAIRLGQGRQAGAFLAKAEGWALPAGQREAFVALLAQAREAAARHRSAANTVMAERAAWLQANVDDLF